MRRMRRMRKMRRIGKIGISESIRMNFYVFISKGLDNKRRS